MGEWRQCSRDHLQQTRCRAEDGMYWRPCNEISNSPFANSNSASRLLMIHASQPNLNVQWVSLFVLSGLHLGEHFIHVCAAHGPGGSFESMRFDGSIGEDD